MKKKQLYKMETLYDFFMKMGHDSGCHQLPQRSYYINGRQFPVCARCMGLLAGYIVGLTLLPWGILDMKVCMVACCIMFADWYIQYLNIMPSHNLRRLLTGAVCGIGYLHIWVRIAWMVWKWLVEYIV